MDAAAEQPRHPAGAPRHTGGQWREQTLAEAGIDLSPGREEAIAAGEAVPATFTTEPASGLAGDWWDTQASVAEWGGEGAAYPKMPCDWTPGLTRGGADSGLRRTHRMTYSGNGFSLRMPSATSIRSFAAANRGAFDVPVEATNAEGKSITAWVRAVRHGPTAWSVSGLGFGGVTDAQVSEAVSSVLEARRPSVAMRQAGDLIERHRQRVADQGVQTESIRSSWIAAVGYDDVDGLMIMRTRSRVDKAGVTRPGKDYGSSVPLEVYEELTASDAPGRIFNTLIRGKAPGALVETCARCDRTYARSRSHTCPAEIASLSAPPQAQVDQTEGRRSALRGIRRRRGWRAAGGGDQQ